MRHAWVYIYERPPATTRFDELVRQIELFGLSLTYPPTGRVIRLGLPGHQVMTTRDELRDRFTNSSQVGFIFYLNSTTSVISCWDKLDKRIWREGYSLDGNSEQQSRLVINMLADLFRQRALSGTAFAFVADEHAELHRDFHWDDFVIGDTVPPEWPMQIGLSRDSLQVDKIPTEIYNVERSDAYILFQKEATD